MKLKVQLYVAGSRDVAIEATQSANINDGGVYQCPTPHQCFSLQHLQRQKITESRQVVIENQPQVYRVRPNPKLLDILQSQQRQGAKDTQGTHTAIDRKQEQYKTMIPDTKASLVPVHKVGTVTLLINRLCKVRALEIEEGIVVTIAGCEESLIGEETF